MAKETGILRELYNDKSPEGVSRHENIEELLNAIQEFSNLALEEGRPLGIGDYLQEVALLTDQDTENKEDRNRVTLMTVHSAKGLEFKNVFIVGLEKNLFPSAQAGETMSKEAYEEERRLFYVALTRAKQQVYLSYADQRYRWGKPEFCRPSPFIDEIDPAFLEISNQGTNRFAQKLPFRLPFSRNLPGKESGNIQQQPDLLSNFSRKIAMLKESSGKEKDRGDDETVHLIHGMMVEHQRFGIGKVLQVEGNPPDEKATVFFHNAGQKQLLLRFARLRIIT